MLVYSFILCTSNRKSQRQAAAQIELKFIRSQLELRAFVNRTGTRRRPASAWLAGKGPSCFSDPLPLWPFAPLTLCTPVTRLQCARPPCQQHSVNSTTTNSCIRSPSWCRNSFNADFLHQEPWEFKMATFDKNSWLLLFPIESVTRLAQKAHCAATHRLLPCLAPTHDFCH